MFEADKLQEIESEFTSAAEMEHIYFEPKPTLNNSKGLAPFAVEEQEGWRRRSSTRSWRRS